MQNNNQSTKTNGALDFSGQRNYWMEKMQNIMEAKNSIPYDFNYNNYELNNINLEIQGDLFLTLNKLAGDSYIKEYIILVTALNVLVSKYTSYNDILLGIPVLIDKNYNVDVRDSNRVLIHRNQRHENDTFKSLLLNVRKDIVESFKNQSYPFELLNHQINKEQTNENFNSYIDIIAIHEQIQNSSFDNSIIPNIIFLFCNQGDKLGVCVKYNKFAYKEVTIKTIIQRFFNILNQILTNIDGIVENISMVSDEEYNKILHDFNSNIEKCRLNTTVHELFEEKVKERPNDIAVICEEKFLTYKQLDEKANQIANYLYEEKKVQKEERIGILLDKTENIIVSILGILKAGGAYVPIDPELPFQRIAYIIKDAGINKVISEKKYRKILNTLQYECENFDSLLCIDTFNVYEVEDLNQLMDTELWDYIAESSSDDIEAGGWVNSYTGKPFKKKEMKEYSDNILKKLSEKLTKDMKVLEIGCGSGLTMYEVAPKVKSYYGIDISEKVIEMNKKNVEENGYDNIRLSCSSAHEIDFIEEKNFNLIIINSVIQSFPGYNYLQDVINKCINLLDDNGYIFIGDVMDHDLKYVLINDLKQFKLTHKNEDIKTKVEWNNELFVSKTFFEDLCVDIKEISKVEFSNKLFTIENELTKFRYDTCLYINKLNTTKDKIRKKKYQDDLNNLLKHKTEKCSAKVTQNNLIYVIYTSGTTGYPKGVMVEHRNVINLIEGLQKEIYGKYQEKMNIGLVASYGFDASVQQIFASILKGHTLHIISNDIKRDGDKLIDFCRENKIDIIDGTPSHLKLIISSLRNRNISLAVKNFIIGGSKLEYELAKDILQCDQTNSVTITNVYGPTECCVDSTAISINKSNISLMDKMTIGSPLLNQRIYILNNNKIQPIGVIGEICIGGCGVARGYLCNDQLTRQKFIVNPFIEDDCIYKTGDMGRWLEDGTIEYIERKDSQIKLNGFRIELDEIRKQLLEIDEIEDAVVVCEEDKNNIKYLCAYVVLNCKRNTSEFSKALEEILPKYMIPSKFKEVKQIPLTLSGKVDINRLKVVGEEIKYSRSIIKPRNEVEQAVFDVWREYLNFESASIDDNFFKLGGDSIKGMLIINRYRQLMDETIYVGLIFKENSIEKQAIYLKEKYPEKIGKLTNKDMSKNTTIKNFIVDRYKEEDDNVLDTEYEGDEEIKNLMSKISKNDINDILNKL